MVAWLSSCPVPLTDHLSALISALINHAIGSEDSAGAERTTVFSGDTRDDVLQQVAHALFPETDATDADDVDKGRCSNRILELGGRRIGNAARDAGQLAELIDGDLEREEANS